MSETASVCLLLGSVFISACSQILLKKSTERQYASFWKEYTSLPVMTAYALFVLSALLTTIAYRGLEVSFGNVLENLGIFFVMILGRIFLREKIGPRRLAALALVTAGILLFHS